MRLLVFLAVGVDVRIPPQLDPRSGRVRAEWLVPEVDPASAHALDLALALKANRPGTEVRVMGLGPAQAEPWLRQALARDCDQAVRIWDDQAAEAGTAGKAVILAAAAQIVGFDLALAGAAGVINAGGQLGVLLAERLGVPCVTEVVAVTSVREAVGGDGLEIMRGLDRGYRERVEARLPAVTTVSAGVPGGETAASPKIPARSLLTAQNQEIPVWNLADLGVPSHQVRSADRPMRYGRPRPIRPRLRRLPVPDPALPAFERILKLVQGSVQHREGRVVRRPSGEVVEEVFGTLKDEGWLDHLRPDSLSAKGATGDGEP